MRTIRALDVGVTHATSSGLASLRFAEEWMDRLTILDVDKVPIWSHGQLEGEQQWNASSLVREDVFCFIN